MTQTQSIPWWEEQAHQEADPQQEEADLQEEEEAHQEGVAAKEEAAKPKQLPNQMENLWVHYWQSLKEIVQKLRASSENSLPTY